MAQPLDGIRVLDVSTVLAAPLTASLLAEFGAEVIKVEQPTTGDPVRGYAPYLGDASLHHKVTNRNKKSVTLDFHKPGAARMLRELAAASDVVITNFRPRKLRKWGIDYEDLAEANPRLLMLHLTAFGRTGPYADRPGFARIAEAFSGLTYVTGFEDRPPVFAGYPIADGIAGIYGAFSVMLALVHRDRTGEGQLIDLALYEPMLRMLEDFIIGYAATGQVKERSGNAQPNICPNNLYPTADGQFLILPVSTEQMWRRLVAVMGATDLLNYGTNQQRLAHRSQIDGRIEEFTRSLPVDRLLKLLDEHGIACGKLYSVAEILDDPHIRERGNLIDIHDDETDTMLTMQAPVPQFSTITGSVKSVGPRLGQHTDEIYQSLLGLDGASLERLRSEGVI